MKKYLAEFLGTFVLVFIGCGSAAIAGEQIGFTGISFAFGLSVLVMVHTIGPVSGCHINPAVTIGMLFTGKIDTKNASIYVLVQILGAIFAAMVLWAIMGSNDNLGQNGYGNQSPLGYGLCAAFVTEVVLTAIFLWVIFSVTNSSNPNSKFAGLTIGLALVFIHLVGIPVTGTSVNPARSLGPAIIVGGEVLSQSWLFVVAPILGGILGGIVWKYILGGDQAQKI